LATATTGTLSFNTPANGASPAGTYPIDGSGLTAKNYILVQAPPNATALTLQVPIDTNPNNGVTTAIDTHNGVFPIPFSYENNNGNAPSLTFQNTDGEPVTDVTISRASSLPPDTGDADTAINVGRIVVRYRTEIRVGQVVYAPQAGSLAMASSFTTFDKRDHPASRIKHGKTHGEDKVPIKNENANGPSGGN